MSEREVPEGAGQGAPEPTGVALPQLERSYEHLRERARVRYRIRRVVSRVGDVGMLISGGAIVLIMLVVVTATAGRAVGVSIVGADEASRYLLVIAIYTGLAYTLREEGFVRVRMLQDRFTGLPARLADAGITLVSLGYSGALTWYFALQALQSYERGTRSIGALEFPIYLPQFLMVVGMALLTIELLVRLVVGPPHERPVSSSES